MGKVGQSPSRASEQHATRARNASILRESEALLAQSEQLGNIGSWAWDVQNDVVTWSDQLYRIFGLSVHEFPGSYRGFLERVVPEDRAMVTRAIESGFTHGSFEMECRIRRPDGELRILDCRGQTVSENGGTAIRMFGIARDVTEERAREHALRESEERFRRAFEDSGLGMSLADLKGRFLRVNRELCRITGRKSEELLEMSFEDVTHPDDRAHGWVGAREIISGRRQRWQREKRYVRPDGRVVWAQVTTSLVRTPDGKPSHFVTQVEDITERLRLNAEHKALEVQFHQAQKMEAVARLAGGVAHDFNNLLAAILGNCEMLLEDTELPAALRAQIEEIREAAGFGETIAAQLLDLGRRRAVRREIVDLSQEIARMRSVLQRLVGESVTLELKFPDSPVRVVGDAGALEQVVLNLAVNARDAMPEGGKFSLELKVADVVAGDLPPHLVSDPDTQAVIVAADTGIGMDPGVQERVFEPFFTTKKGELATGLGLSTVFQIVSQAGGHVSVESVVGEGTAFHIHLPLADEPAAGAIKDNEATA